MSSPASAGCSCGRSIRYEAKSPGPGPRCRRLSLTSFDQALGPSWQDSRIPDRPFGGDPIHSHPAHRPRTTRQQLRAASRQATTPGPPTLRALTRVPRCATRARRTFQTTPGRPSGSAFPLKTGSVFSVGITLPADIGEAHTQLSFAEPVGGAAVHHLSEPSQSRRL